MSLFRKRPSTAIATIVKDVLVDARGPCVDKEYARFCVNCRYYFSKEGIQWGPIGPSKVLAHGCNRAISRVTGAPEPWHAEGMRKEGRPCGPMGLLFEPVEGVDVMKMLNKENAEK